ncbi:MAG: chondroitinase family polysaccharide lyase, partial [Planctomycetota bacterium]
MFRASDYQTVEVAGAILRDALLPEFESAVEAARNHVYDRGGEPAYFDFKVFPEDEVSAARAAQDRSNRRLTHLLTEVIPVLAYAYRTPGANPFYRNDEVLRLYIRALEYGYGRGLTEEAWTPDHGARASGKALKAGLVRSSGDFSGISLYFGGFIQSIFLMREPLAEAGLLEKYRAVARNLAVNSGVMYQVFFEVARAEAGVDYGYAVSDEAAYYLNADGIRLFVDYFWPYFLLIEDEAERERMTAVLEKVIAVNVAKKSGTQDTIKPDGVGFHHNAAYVGAYSPYAIEAMGRLLYLVADADYHTRENIDAVK